MKNSTEYRKKNRKGNLYLTRTYRLMMLIYRTKKKQKIKINSNKKIRNKKIKINIKNSNNKFLKK